MELDQRIRMANRVPSHWTERGVWLTEQQALHEHAMKNAVLRMQDTPYVFKGGTALALLYGLDRHSQDIDFDASEPIEAEEVRRRIESGLRDAGVTMSGFIVHKDTEIGQRFKVHYLNPGTGQDMLMNVDMSFRHVPQASEFETVAGIRAYKLQVIFDQKLDAARGRTQARDLYDLGFIVDRHGGLLSDDQITRADAFTNDVEQLAGWYEQAFQADRFLRAPSAHEDAALRLRCAVEEQLSLRS